MLETPKSLFSFAEPDHLIRIHVLLELEDAGFTVEEEGAEVSIVQGRKAVSGLAGGDQH